MSNTYMIVAFIAIAYVLSKRRVFSKEIKNVDGEEAYKLINEVKELIIIDVRTNQEYKSGHISGAKCIPVHEISSRITDLESYKEKPVIVYCASGGRSPEAVKILLNYGFKNLYHMKRGLNHWSYGLEK